MFIRRGSARVQKRILKSLLGWFLLSICIDLAMTTTALVYVVTLINFGMGVQLLLLLSQIL